MATFVLIAQGLEVSNEFVGGELVARVFHGRRGDYVGVSRIEVQTQRIE